MTETIAEQLPRLRESIDESAPAEIAEIFDYSTRSEPEQILAALDALARA